MKIIMNPPYNKHLKILSRVIEQCPDAEIVNLSPIRWLQDPLAEVKQSTDWKKFEDVRENISSVDVVNAKRASEMFGMLVSTDLGVYHLDRSGKHYEDLRNKIAQKIFNKGCYFTSFDKDMKDGWRVRVVLVDNCKAGGSSKNGKVRFQRLLSFKDGMKDGKPWYEHFGKCGWSKVQEDIPTSLKFKSEKEAENFINVMTKSKLGIYYWTAMQQDVHVYPQFFINIDYSHPWTDEDLYKYFELSAEEIQEIEAAIKC